MRADKARRSFAWVLVMGGLVVGSHMGCGGDSGGGPNGGTPSAACSSCQEAYTEDDCKRWGDLAGCEESTVSTEDTCAMGIAGCSFKNCVGPPLCDDLGEAQCASCDGDLSQSDCDALAESAGCTTAGTTDFTACGNPAIGCTFTGCDYRPSCE